MAAHTLSIWSGARGLYIEVDWWSSISPGTQDSDLVGQEHHPGSHEQGSAAPNADIWACDEAEAHMQLGRAQQPPGPKGKAHVHGSR